MKNCLQWSSNFNPQNDRVLAKKRDNISEHLKTVYRQQNLPLVMVWVAVSKMWKSPLSFIKQSTKLNTNVYIEDILIPASQAMKKQFGNENFTFQQDDAPFHTSRKTQVGCRANFFEFLEQGNMAPCFT